MENKRGRPFSLEQIKSAVVICMIAGKSGLVDFEKWYPGVTNTDNVNDIIIVLK